MGGTDAARVDEVLALADWRRTIAGLYADVRRIATTDSAEALGLWRATRDRLYREHPQSPVPEADRRSFGAVHFEPDPRLRFEVVVEPPQSAKDAPGRLGQGAIDFGSGGEGSAGAVDLPVSGGGLMAFRRFGRVTIPFPDGERALEVYWMEGYAGGLFLPFRDATNGIATYGAGRYLLDAAKGADLGGDRADRTLVLDFNFAYQPSCAFDPKWACPLAPPANRLDIAVRAGERLA